jgi:hypothetical protein
MNFLVWLNLLTWAEKIESKRWRQSLTCWRSSANVSKCHTLLSSIYHHRNPAKSVFFAYCTHLLRFRGPSKLPSSRQLMRSDQIRLSLFKKIKVQRNISTRPTENQSFNQITTSTSIKNGLSRSKAEWKYILSFDDIVRSKAIWFIMKAITT